MEKDAFFECDGGYYLPHDDGRGFWSDALLSGRVVVGLIGQEVEHRHALAGFRPARLMVDMFRPVPFRPLRLETEVIRSGGRLQLVEAKLFDEDRELSRAQAMFVRTGNAPEGKVWSHPLLVSPDPETLPAEQGGMKRPVSEIRRIAGAMGSYGPRQVWIREIRPMVAGRAHTPWSRLAAMADLASPWAHSGDKGIAYINSDIVLQASRLPDGEWIGLEALLHSADSGVAVGTCRIFDEQGPLGQISSTALANVREN